MKEWVRKRLFTFVDIPQDLKKVGKMGIERYFSVAITFFRLIFVEMCGKVEWFYLIGDMCKICRKDGWLIVTQSFTNSSLDNDKVGGGFVQVIIICKEHVLGKIIILKCSFMNITCTQTELKLVFWMYKRHASIKGKFGFNLC